MQGGGVGKRQTEGLMDYYLTIQKLKILIQNDQEDEESGNHR